uniref:Uncharacterized protein n=1 Tax=Thermogemmatispora argillosa TaxID=2045280 RepID=A0A455SY86_9CHLR|nr:hypothetical protein KTA_15920 [Thermogemmatispora argillosa]
MALSDPAAAPSAPVPGSSLLLLRSRFAPGLDPDSFLSQYQQEIALTSQRQWWRPPQSQPQRTG